MKKLIMLLISLLVMTNCTLSYASTNNLSKIEAIIAGKQDKLVFATISNIGSSASSISVIEEIGDIVHDEDGEEEVEIPSVVGQEIEISGLSSYMYFSPENQTPKIGDNILVSLSFEGNVYHIKNGAFLVNEASYSTFKFLVPESVENTDGAMELTALYKFVSSNGKNADYTVKNSAVYTHDINNNEVRTTEPEGIVFVDESGTKTKETVEPSGVVSGDTVNPEHTSPYTWIKASFVILLGMIVGVFVVRGIMRLEKRSESK